jgi:hypothetical protein
VELLEPRNLLTPVNVLVNNTAEDTASNDTQSETSITVAQNGNVVVGFNDSEEFSSGNHFIGYGFSSNGGSSFTDGGALPVTNLGDGGDPALASNLSTGKVFFASLGLVQNNTIQFYKSSDNGQTFPLKANAAPGFDTSHFLDKDWMAVDNSTAAGTGKGYIYVTYTDFGPATTKLFLSRSTDGGTTWTKTRFGNTNGVQGTDVVVGATHAVYVFWFDENGPNERILTQKSTDNGQTFGTMHTAATLRTVFGDGDLNLGNNDGSGLGFRSNAFPQAVANPTVAGKKNIYLVYDDVGTQTGDAADVFFTQSNDGGTTWTAPVKLNDDTTTNDQWQPAIAVTPDGSHLMVSWYDRRNDPTNALIDRYGVIGSISGTTVSFGANFKINDVSFPAVDHQDTVFVSDYMGDYDQMAATNANFYTTWGDNRLPDTKHAHNPDVRFAAVPVGTAPGAQLVVHGLGDRGDTPDLTRYIYDLGTPPASSGDLGPALAPPPAAGTGSAPLAHHGAPPAAGGVDTHTAVGLGQAVVPPPAGGTTNAVPPPAHTGATGLAAPVDQVFATGKAAPAASPAALYGAAHGHPTSASQADDGLWPVLD